MEENSEWKIIRWYIWIIHGLWSKFFNRWSENPTIPYLITVEYTQVMVTDTMLLLLRLQRFLTPHLSFVWTFIHFKALVWCWEGLGAGGKGDGRGWDGWMASPTWWAWVWVNYGRWWWTGRPGMLQFMGSQRVGHDWETEMNWTELQHFWVEHINVFWYHLKSYISSWTTSAFPSKGILNKLFSFFFQISFYHV